MAVTLGDTVIAVGADVSKFKAGVQRALLSTRRIARETAGKIGTDVNTGLMNKFTAYNPFEVLGKKFQETAKQARMTLQNLIRTGFFVGPLITAIAGALGSLGASLATLVSLVGSATPALMTLGNSLSAVLQAAITAQQAFRGVGQALQLGLRADQAQNDSRAIEAALKRVEEARIRLRNIINKEQPERMAAAREAAANAERQAANATRSAEAALRSYNEAQRRTVEAIEDLNDARDRAREKIQQLRFETEGAAISEQQARLSFERARDSLQAVQDLPPNSRARQEAELAFAEADLNLRRAIDRNSDLKKEEEAATRAGVEGSDEVLTAKRAIEQATQAEADAQYRAAEAFLDAAKARERAAKAAEDAAEGGRVQQEINAQIAQARESLKQALQDLEDTRGGGSAAAEFEKALAKLSPAAADFVRYLVEIREEFNVLRDSAATGLFPLLTTAIDNVRARLPQLTPLFGKTGEAVGGVAVGISEAFTGAEEFSKVETIWENNNSLIESFGRSIANVIRALQNLLVAAGPVTQRFADWIDNITSGWADSTGSDIDGLTDRFNRAGDVAADLGKVIGGWFDVFRELGRIIMAPGGAGELLLSFFQQANEGALEFLRAGGTEGDGSLVEKFRQATDNGTKLLSIITDVVKILFDLGASENLGTFLDSIQRAVGNFGTVGEEIDQALPSFGEFIENLAIITRQLTEGGQITTFFTTLNTALTTVTQILENESVQAVLDFLGEIAAVVIAFRTVTQVGQFFGNAAAGAFMTPFSAISDFSQRVGDVGVRLEAMGQKGGIMGRLGRAGSTTFTRLATIVGRFAGPFALIGIAIAGVILYLRDLYDRSEEFKAAWDGFFEKIRPSLERFQEAWGLIKGAFQDLWDTIKEAFSVFSSDVDSGVTSNFTLIGDVIAIVVDRISRVIQVMAGVFRAVFAVIGGVIRGAATFIGAVFRGIAQFIGGFISAIQGVWGIISGVWELIVGLLTGNEEAVENAKNKIIQKFADLGRGIVNMILGPIRIIVGAVDGLLNFLGGVVNGLIELINTAIRAFNDITSGWKIKIPDWGIFGDLAGREFGLPRIPEIGFRVPMISLASKIPEIPRWTPPAMARGGIVPAISGGMLALIGEAGRSERVEPLDPDGLSRRDKAMINFLTGGGAGATINVYPSPGMDEEELATLVSRKLARQMRTGAF